MDENSIRRVRPHSKEAEQSVIGAMLMDRNVISDLADLLTKEDFYNAQYGILYDAMVDLYREGQPVDVITLSNKLKTKDVPEEISSTAFIAEIISAVPTSANAKQYAQIVQDKSALRKLIRLCEDTEKDCYIENESAGVILEQAEESVFKLVQGRTRATDIVPIRSIVIDVIAEIEEAARNKGQVTGLSTGF